MKSCRHKTGVTLLEMLIVVAVIGLLVTIVVTTATRIQNQAKEQLTKATFVLLESALQEYHEYEGKFPTAVPGDPNMNSEILYEELSLIPSSKTILGKISGSLIQNNPDNVPEIYDPWDKELQYSYTNGDNFPKITSAGPDKKIGTVDDITNR